MAKFRQFELDEIVNRPGTYFNPQTAVLIVVDDSPELDTEVFNMDDFEGAEWVLIADDIPVDEEARDVLMQAFQVRHADPFAAGLDGDDELVDDDENAEPEADEVEEL